MAPGKPRKAYIQKISAKKKEGKQAYRIGHEHHLRFIYGLYIKNT